MELNKFTVFLIVYFFLFCNYFAFILFLFRGLKNLSFSKNNNNLRASVIIPFRNEEGKISRCVDSINRQSLQKDRFEVILVNDSSTDSSTEKIKEYLNNNNFKLLNLQSEEISISNKKRAIDLGIQKANNEIIVTTDADCWHDRDWLANILSCFDDNVGFVAGKVIYSDNETFFSRLQKLEFASLVIIGFALLGKGLPLLANGASCAYRKKLFFEVGGFTDNFHLASGDEEFLMQKIKSHTRYKVKACINSNSTTYTDANKNLIEFINQRKRWSSKIPYYPNKKLLAWLVSIYLFYFSTIILILISLFYSTILYMLAIILIIKYVVDFSFIRKGATYLNFNIEKKLLPIAEFIHLPYIVIIPLLGIFGKFNWKGRIRKR